MFSEYSEYLVTILAFSVLISNWEFWMLGCILNHNFPCIDCDPATVLIKVNENNIIL